MITPHIALQFLLQLAVILLACRIVGWLMMRVGQPKVIGEMIAGILLGPSLLGLLAPSVQNALFPPASLGLLSTVSKVGIVLYMFVVGTHVQTGIIRQAYRSAMLISAAGVVVPLALGAALAVFFHEDGRFFAPERIAWGQHAVSRRRHGGDGVSRAGAHHSGARHRGNGAWLAGAGGGSHR